jgi:hypothetical protein
MYSLSCAEGLTGRTNRNEADALNRVPVMTMHGAKGLSANSVS